MKNTSNQLDQIKINRLKMAIIALERENLKTKKYRDYEMEEKVLKLIERVVLD